MIHKASVATVVDAIMGSGKSGRANLVKRHRELLITGPLLTPNLGHDPEDNSELLIVDVFTPEERMELSIFRNQICHLFVLEASPKP